MLNGRRRLAILFALVLATIAQSAAAEEITGSQKDPVALNNRLATPVEFLRNFKYALDNDLFLREGFYSDENLKKFFAATRISWIEKNLPERQSGDIICQSSFGISLAFGTTGKRSDPTARVRYGGGSLGAKLAADQVIELFGAPMKVTNPYAAESPAHPSALMRKTHELGNLSIEYRFERSTSTASFSCLMNGDGSINRCNFSNAEK
jgi:hypothetical protein